MNKISVRPAKLEDIEDIAHVNVSSWCTAFSGFVAPEFIETEILVENFLPGLSARFEQKTKTSRLFVAENTQQIIGMASCNAAREKRYKDWGEVGSLYVLPEQHGKGAGSMLLKACFKHLRTCGFEKTYIRTFAHSEQGRAFYSKLGGILSLERGIVELGANNYETVFFEWHNIPS